MNKCEDCVYWVKHSDIWGDCIHPQVATGWFKCYSNWCREGRMARHSSSRYKRQNACKTRFIKKEINNE